MTRTPTKMSPPAETHPIVRRVEEPAVDLLAQPARRISEMAYALRNRHSAALLRYGSDSGGWHAFDPATMDTAGVFDGTEGFPDGTVVSKLAWGRITESFAQRLLESDGVNTEES